MTEKIGQLTEQAEEAMTNKALDAFSAAGIATMTKRQASVYLTAAMQAAFSLLRTVEGDEFLQGWLASAVADLDIPPTFALRRPS
jgi:hypothetical protein